MENIEQMKKEYISLRNRILFKTSKFSGSQVVSARVEYFIAAVVHSAKINIARNLFRVLLQFDLEARST
jgi:hypothetical protein